LYLPIISAKVYTQKDLLIFMSDKTTLSTKYIALFVIAVFVFMGFSKEAQATPVCSSQTITSPGGGTVYYVSPTGSDSNNGTSPCTPWQTMSKANSSHPVAGVTIAFEGGYYFCFIIITGYWL
jgi:hypothetical protein